MDKNNFSYLLVALLVLLFGIPLADDLAILSGPVVRAFLFSILFVIGVWSLRGSGWFFLAGIWLAIGHLMAAVSLFITIIGIPFAIQHIKFIEISLFPIGKTIVSSR